MPIDDKPYIISADQLIETSRKRDIIPLTLSADIALGGGIPLGCTVVLAGKAKSGKTTTALQYGANAQNLYGSKIFFFPIEGRLTSLVLSQIQGLKTTEKDFVVVLPPAIYDKKGNVVGNQRWSAEKWWSAIGETVVQNPRSVLIVDSIASLSSEKEQSEGMGYQDRGSKQKLEAEFCRLYGDLVIPNQVTLFLLTQVQANTSGYGPPIQPKMGNGIRHQADVILFAKSVEKWKPENDRIMGHDITLTVETSNLGPPFIDLVIPLRYGYGIDQIKDLATHAMNWELIKAKGSWYVLPFREVDNTFKFDDNLDDESFKIQGEAGIRNWLNSRPEQSQELAKIIKGKIFGTKV